ncbi:MAG: hypothetical protein LBM63_04760 [Rikenellaceae bacterium]|jgi:hypothetical protein|nr:hypothetical protein [Rikenellaceae bacterium]
MKRFLLGLLGLLAVACNPAAKFAVVEVEGPCFDGLTTVHTRAVVENSSRRDLTIKSATLVFGYKARELATARLMLPLTVHARSTEWVDIDLRIESTSLAGLRILERRATLNPAEVTVSVKAEVGFGRTRREVELRDVPLSAIISNFGVINPTVE